MNISRPISRSISGGAESVIKPDETSSFYLDFINGYYGFQSAELAIANTWKPQPTLSADFLSGFYFVGS